MDFRRTVTHNICEPDAESCSPPPKVQHTVVVDLYQREFLSGSDVTYQCRDRFQMEGDATIRCNDGNWEKHNIVCAQPCRFSGTTKDIV
ncbi:unnamed protein product [Pleuronectes platessa]|uniref:Sushi domain-containing protein n=1 Tax=Pleuronectes platessa TaxID=8262 RepID=A0A9N7Z1V1_PLEPL|nr:unnamed protein product [Pleuronectes platessa]